MYFTSGQDRAFERLMQEKPSFDHYDGGGANAPEDWDYTLSPLAISIITGKIISYFK